MCSAEADLPRATRRFLAAAPEPVAGIRFFPEGTKTAVDAAAAVGCEVSAIVKSLVFVVSKGEVEEPVVALVPGDLRLDPAKLAQAAGAEKARRAGLDEAREATGFAAGGTPPFGHVRRLRVFADPALRRHQVVWAAAGTPNTVFPIRIEDLDRWASPRWTQVT